MDKTYSDGYTRPQWSLSTLDKLLSLLESLSSSFFYRCLFAFTLDFLSHSLFIPLALNATIFLLIHFFWGLTLILICPTIVHFYYSHILPIFLFDFYFISTYGIYVCGICFFLFFYIIFRFLLFIFFFSNIPSCIWKKVFNIF